ncbi:MAG: lysine--tRNA ligase, partial [Oscillospiraceae bacterium]|nr:lysine--tRNA ligase [Oscillospiraceae bacterium]
MNEEVTVVETEEDVHELKRIRMEKLEALKAEGHDPFEITKFDVTAHSAQIKAEYEALEARLKAECADDEALKAALEENRRTVRIAGRIMSRRDMGKANFINILDRDGNIQ